MMTDKKLVAAFRGFVEKVFLPALKKTDPALTEWAKFNQLLSQDGNAYEEAAQYVDGLGGTSSTPSFALDKREVPLFKKRTQEAESVNSDGGSFNPSKTFGGERARMMFMKGEMDDYSEPRQGGFGFSAARNNDSARTQGFTSPQTILPGLERLCKTFLENQGRI
jgi:hypothetical protein